MKYLGLDLGNRTCGVSVSDDSGIIATSMYTVRFFEKDLDNCLKQIIETTIEAHRIMLEADMSRNKRKQKVDTLAATLILQAYLDSNR